MPTRNDLDLILKAYASEPDPIYPERFDGLVLRILTKHS